jgi:hypothetical protein
MLILFLRVPRALSAATLELTIPLAIDDPLYDHVLLGIQHLRIEAGILSSRLEKHAATRAASDKPVT